MKSKLPQLIEEIADKTLSQGCIVESKKSGLRWVLVDESPIRICGDYLNDYGCGGCCDHQYDKRNIKVVGHPVMLGDVLEKIKVPLRGNAFRAGEMYLLNLWLPLGFNKSLNQIIEESGWRGVGNEVMDEESGQYSIRTELKNPQAQALCEYLLTILTNSEKE